ncbi:hypothetical protein D3C73_1177390 [compost metagenome]
MLGKAPPQFAGTPQKSLPPPPTQVTVAAPADDAPRAATPMAIAAESGRRCKWDITGDRRRRFILGFQVLGLPGRSHPGAATRSIKICERLKLSKAERD